MAKLDNDPTTLDNDPLQKFLPRIKGKIINILVKLENRGFSDIKGVSYRPFYLARFIANIKGKNTYKEIFVKGYNYNV